MCVIDVINKLFRRKSGNIITESLLKTELGLIYVRTCRVRNGYRTGHVDVSGTHTPIDAFMLERDGLATGKCAQRGPSSNRR